MSVEIVPARALGDGVLGMVLAHNLHRAGRDVTVRHTALTELAAWLPWARIEPLPDATGYTPPLEADGLFVGEPAAAATLPPATRRPRPTVVFGKDDWLREQPYLRSLEHACAQPFELDTWTDEAGFVYPTADAPSKQAPRRIALHPTSARANKNWPAARWVALAGRLQQRGWQPQVLLAEHEVTAWRSLAGENVEVMVPGALDAVAHWLRTCEACIATDSGIAHLASAVGTPTLTLFRKPSAACFWAPAWGLTATVTAPWRLPGAGGHRLWGRLLTPARVQAALERLLHSKAR